MQTTKLIALCGRAGSGKTTCGDWLVKKRGAVEFSLAEPLKLLAMEVFGFTREQVFGTQEQKETVDPRYGFSPREALIRLGQAARKHLGEDVWLDACLKRIRERAALLSVVTDVRFNNEAEALYKAGASVIRLTCPNAATSVDPNAASEASVDQIDPRWLYKDLVIERSPGASVLLDVFENETKALR